MTQIKYKHDDFYMFPHEREREIERNLIRKEMESHLEAELSVCEKVGGKE